MNPLELTFSGVIGLAPVSLFGRALTDVLVTGPVGEGKSTIVDLIQIALTGECPRGKLKDVAEGTAELTFRFEHDGTEYRVQQTAKKSKSTATLEFHEYDGWHAMKETPAQAIGVKPDVLAAACFLRSKGASGHGTFGPSGRTERRALLGSVDRGIPPDLFAQWSKGAGMPAVAALVRSDVTADAMPALAKKSGQDSTAAANEHAKVKGALEEVIRASEADRATLDGASAPTVDLAPPRAALTAASDARDAKRAEHDRAERVAFTAERRRMDAERQLADLDKKHAAIRDAVKRREVGLPKWRELGGELLAVDGFIGANETAMNDAITKRAAASARIESAMKAHAASLPVSDRAAVASEIASLRATLDATKKRAAPVVVPCGASKQYQGCTFLTDTIAARADVAKLEDAITHATARLAVLEAACNAPPPDVSADVEAVRVLTAEIDAINAKLTDLHRQRATIDAKRTTIADELRPLKEIAAQADVIDAADGEVAKLRTIIAEPLPPRPAPLDLMDEDTAVRMASAALDEAQRANNVHAAAIARREDATARLATAEKRVSDLTAKVAETAATRDAYATLERYYREAPLLAVKSMLDELQDTANAHLTAMQSGLVVRLDAPPANAAGVWGLDVYVNDGTKETAREGRSEGQLLMVDLALSAALRAYAGLSWCAVDDGFGGINADVAAKVAPTLGAFVVAHNPAIVAALGSRAQVRVGGGKVEVGK